MPRGARLASCPGIKRRRRAVIASLLVLSLAPIDLGHLAWAKGKTRATAKSSTPKPVPPRCDRSKFRIVLDVGHTAEAPGAKSARNVGEFEFNLHLARRIEERLKSEGFVQTSVLVTEGKAKPSLFKRVAAVNKSRVNLFLSIHHDSVPDDFLEDWEFEGKTNHFSDRFGGYSVFVSRKNPQFTASLKFARLLGNQMAAQDLQFARQYDQLFMGRYQRQLLDFNAGVYRHDHLVVLERARMAAVLLEAGSIINRDEELVVASPEHQGKVSTAVAGAVQQFCESR